MTIEQAHEHFGRGLLKKACALCGNLDDAEDLLSAMWVNAIRSWGQCNEEFPEVRAKWLHRILLNVHFTRMRSGPRGIEVPMDEDVEIALSRDVPNGYDRLQFREKLLSLAGPRGATVLRLAYVEGMKCHEIAQIIATEGKPVTVSNVRLMLYRARYSVRKRAKKLGIRP